MESGDRAQAGGDPTGARVVGRTPGCGWCGAGRSPVAWCGHVVGNCGPNPKWHFRLP